MKICSRGKRCGNTCIHKKWKCINPSFRPSPICSKGKRCGNTCINKNFKCSKPEKFGSISSESNFSSSMSIPSFSCSIASIDSDDFSYEDNQFYPMGQDTDISIEFDPITDLDELLSNLLS